MALALVASGSISVWAGTGRLGLDLRYADGGDLGWVNTVEPTVFSRSGATPSPSACHIAMRPCIAATDASISSPVQSPAA